MRLAGQRGQGCGHLMDAGADIGGGCSGVASAVGVARVGLGDRVAEAALDPGQGGVPDPVHADLLGPYPGEMPAEALPQVVISAGGDWPAVAVPQQLPVRGRMSFLAVPDECGHQGGRDRLPADGFSLFPQLDQALFRVEVLRAQGQGAAPPAGGLGVEAEQQGVEVGVIPGGRCCLVDLREALAVDRVAGRGQAAGLVHLAGRCGPPG